MFQRFLHRWNGDLRTIFVFSIPAFLFGALPIATAHVVMSEVLWCGSDLSSADEWIELTNTSTGAINLSGWTLTRFSKGEEIPMIRFGSGDVVDAQSTFLISNYSAEKSRLSVDVDLVTSTVSLANTKLKLTLYNGLWSKSGSLASMIDQIDDGIGAPFAGSNTPPKASMERIDLSLSGTNKENWRTATTFLHFDDGTRMFGTPGAPNGSGFSEDVFPPHEATDFYAEIDHVVLSLPKNNPTLQIVWTPSPSLDLQQQILTFDPPIHSQTGTILSQTATGITFSAADFQNASGATLSMTGITFLLKSQDNLGNTSNGIITISHQRPDVRITEVLANPRGADDAEWIEIANYGTQSVDIGGWLLDESGTSAPHRFSLSGSVLQPQEHRTFTKQTTGLSLTNVGETVTLLRGEKIMDALAYPETAEEVSYGRAIDDPNFFRAFCVPTPGAPNVIIASQPIISIQSGNTTGIGSLSINLQAQVMTGSLVHARCTWNFQDGFLSDSCNPPSHKFTRPGTFPIQLHIVNFCEEQLEQTLMVTIEPSSPTSTAGNANTKKKSKDDADDTACTPRFFDGIRINEFIPNPIGGDAENEFIELINTSQQSIDLCGWKLDDGEKGSKPFVLNGYRLAPHALLLLPRSKTKIAINNSNERIRLFAPDSSLAEEVIFEKSKEGKSYALRSDNIFVWTPFPTPGEVNRFRSVERKNPDDTVIVSAALPNPDGTDTGNEWMEIINVSDHTINLSGWILDNREGSSAPYVIADLILPPKGIHRFPDGITGITFTNTKDQARLLDSEGLIVSVLSWRNAVSGLVYEQPPPGNKQQATVIKVIDGDTIDVMVAEEKKRVRLIGVDTPETVHPTKPVEELGKEASDFTKKSLEGKTITLEFDEERLDKYGRLLAYVILSDGTNFNAELIRRGLSPAYLRFPFKYSDLFAAYEAQAKEAHLGLWANAEIQKIMKEEKEQMEEERILEEEGLILTVDPLGGVVASGTVITLTTNINATIELSTKPHQLSGVILSLPKDDTQSIEIIIFSDLTLHAYAETGSGTRSNEIHETYLIEKSSYETSVLINEVMSAPPTGSGEWIELYNPTGSAALLGGWMLDDESDGGSKPFTLPSDTMIEPFGYSVFTGGLTKLTLNNDGDHVILMDPTGEEHDLVIVPKIKKGLVYAHDPQTASRWCISVTGTPGFANECKKPEAKKLKNEKKLTKLKNSHAKQSNPSSASLDSSDPLALTLTSPPSPLDLIGSRLRPIFSSESSTKDHHNPSELLQKLTTTSHRKLSGYPTDHCWYCFIPPELRRRTISLPFTSFRLPFSFLLFSLFTFLFLFLAILTKPNQLET